MQVEIRKAKLDDFEKIRELNLFLFKNDSQFGDTLDMDWPLKNQDYFKTRIKSKDSCVLVAVTDKIVGYLIGAVTEPETYRKLENLAELENMFVLDSYRSFGIGSKLVKEFLKWCESNGIKRVRVIASVKNKDAINFYKKHGFKDHNLTLETDLSTK